MHWNTFWGIHTVWLSYYSTKLRFQLLQTSRIVGHWPVQCIQQLHSSWSAPLFSDVPASRCLHAYLTLCLNVHSQLSSWHGVCLRNVLWNFETVSHLVDSSLRFWQNSFQGIVPDIILISYYSHTRSESVSRSQSVEWMLSMSDYFCLPHKFHPQNVIAVIGFFQASPCLRLISGWHHQTTNIQLLFLDTFHFNQFLNSTFSMHGNVQKYKLTSNSNKLIESLKGTSVVVNPVGQTHQETL